MTDPPRLLPAEGVTGAGIAFAVIGTGNSGQAFAADLALRGFRVRLAEVPAFAATLDAIVQRGGIELSGEAGQGFARLELITTDLRAAVAGADVVIVGGSAFAHEPVARAAAPHFADGQYVLMTSNFGALRFRRVMAELGIRADVTPVESMSLIYATRALEPGRVAVIGMKDSLPVAALPARRTAAFLSRIAPAFPQFVPADDVLATSLNNLNPIVHPPMVLLNAGRIEATAGQGWNLYADGATESVTRVMLAMDEERMALVARAGVSGVTFRDAFERVYGRYALGRATLSDTLRQSPIHGNAAFPAPASLDTRYLTEDVPFGLVPWASLGRAWGVPTPTIDAAIRLASVMLGVDYEREGVTLGALGVAGMSPEALRAAVR